MTFKTTITSTVMTFAASALPAQAFDIGLWDRDTDGVISETEFDIAWVTATDYSTSYDGDLSGGLDAPEELTGDFSAFDLNGDSVLTGPEIAHLEAVFEEDLPEDEVAD